MATAAAAASPSVPERVASVDAWAAYNEHVCALPSGVEVLIRFPDLGDMILSERLSEKLRNAAARQMLNDSDAVQQGDLDVAEAVEAAKAATPDPDAVEKIAREAEDRILTVARAGAEFERYLVLATVLEPHLEETDLDRLPPADKEFLANVAMREINEDALGRPLGVKLVAELIPFRDGPNRAARRAKQPAKTKRVSAGDKGTL